MTRGRPLLACAGLVLAVGCTPPIAVRRVDAHRAQRELTSNVLTTGELSPRARNLLFDHDLVARYRRDQTGALADLHAAFVAGRLRPYDIASLAEVAFDHAENGGGSPYFLASALYAWVYLFPDDPAAVPSRFDPAASVTSDVYNRGVTRGLERGDTVDLRAGTYPLPFGTLDVTLDPETLRWGEHGLRDFVPVVDLEVKGFATNYRWPGLGAPLAAGLAPEEGAGDRDLLGRRSRVPVTAVLRADDLSRQLRDGHVHAALELHPGYGDEQITVGDRAVPLEAAPTATLGLMLAETSLWRHELRGFLNGVGVITERGRLVCSRPYRPGLIPVVFVHGTGSSTVRWAELYNVLDNDPRIHSRYQFWFFSYETGNPIIYSSMVLRESLEHAVAKLDPAGKDAALRRMVVIGHSQGGLLTKTTVVESGDSLWETLSRKSFGEVRLSEQGRDLLRRAAFIDPLPFVRRVVFLATPHRGSYVAGSWLAHQVARLVTAPL